MGYWDPHPKKEGEEVLKEFHAHGWLITRKKGYYKCLCPPECGQHLKTVHLSPSNPNYYKQLLAYVSKMPCW